MNVEKIVTLANSPMRLQFIAMERSLRQCGCKAPILVIPYDEKKFDLPSGSSWWVMPEVVGWLDSEKASPRFRKYQTYLIKDYQFADPDIIFLKDPANVPCDMNGFIATDTEWNKPKYTFSSYSLPILAGKSSVWQRSVFNSGQFASDIALYTFDELRSQAMSDECIETCVRFPVHDQPGMNLMVAMTGTTVTNLTMPPYSMESTWAGDYLGEYKPLWQDPAKPPYLIHWAGPVMEWNQPINDVFYEFLTKEERTQWDEQVREKKLRSAKKYRRSLPWWKRPSFEMKHLVKQVLRRQD